MFKKGEKAELKFEFWTNFGLHMSQHLSAEGNRVNWVNYRTKVKDLYLRTRSEKNSIYMGLEINHKDLELQALLFEQFTELKTFFHSIMDEEWIWEEVWFNEHGQQKARIYTELKDVNPFIRTNWPQMQEFLEDRLLKFDEFWSDAKISFTHLT